MGFRRGIKGRGLNLGFNKGKTSFVYNLVTIEYIYKDNFSSSSLNILIRKRLG